MTRLTVAADTDVGVKIPEPVVQDDGRIGWPDVFVYRWRDEIQEYVTACPPAGPMPRASQLALFAADDTGRMPHPDAQARSWPYTIEVRPGRLAAYHAIVTSGLLYDPRHTGPNLAAHAQRAAAAVGTPAARAAGDLAWPITTGTIIKAAGDDGGYEATYWIADKDGTQRRMLDQDTLDLLVACANACGGRAGRVDELLAANNKLVEENRGLRATLANAMAKIDALTHVVMAQRAQLTNERQEMSRS